MLQALSSSVLVSAGDRPPPPRWGGAEGCAGRRRRADMETVEQRAQAAREAEKVTASGSGFVPVPLDEGQEKQVVGLWKDLIRSGVHDPFRAGGVDAEGLRDLARSTSPPWRRHPKVQEMIDRGLEVAEGKAMEWRWKGGREGLARPDGRPVKKFRQDAWPKVEWEVEAMEEFVNKALQEEVIERCGKEDVDFSMPVFVVRQGEKKRVIFDARALNNWLPDGTVQYEGIQWMEVLSCPYMGKLDLHSGYYQIPVGEGDRRWLGFSWRKPGEEPIQFRWRVLPFGLSTAPKAFTAMMKILAWRWRQKGILRLIIYLDDIWFGGATFDEWLGAARTILRDLAKAKIRVSAKKAFLGPYSLLEFLGLLVNGISGELSVPQRKMAKLMEMVDGLLEIPSDRRMTEDEVKFLSSFLGLLSFCASGTQGGGIFRRRLDDVLNRGMKGKNTKLGGAVEELKFWKQALGNLTARPLRPPPFWNSELVVDTSDTATGILEVRGTEVRSWEWVQLTPEEQKWSSTAREIVGLTKGIRWLGSKGVRDQSVTAAVDNWSTVVAAGRLAMGSVGLVPAMLELWRELQRGGISLRMSWSPRWWGWVPLADWISKRTANPDRLISRKEAETITWKETPPPGPPVGGNMPCGKRPGEDNADSSRMLNPLIARETVRVLLEQDRSGEWVDGFAEEWNRQPWCAAYCTRIYAPGSLGNTWALDWSGRNLWAFPPFGDLKRTLGKWIDTSPPCRMILVTPDEPWAPLGAAVRILAGVATRSCAVPLTDNRRWGLLIRWSESFDAEKPSSWVRDPPPDFLLRAWLLVK